MSKYINLPTLFFVVFTAVALTACDQGETPVKRPSGMDKSFTQAAMIVARKPGNGNVPGTHRKP